MKLRAVKLRNFRAYQNEVTIEFDSFTALIGRNDVGKSSILEALEIFFNGEVVSLDQHDPSVRGADKTVEITCLFDELPPQLTIDARSITTLQNEYLLNQAGYLEIVKRFECKGKTPKEEVFARVAQPNHALLVDLLRLKNTALKARAREINANLTNVDERSNAALRQAIRQAIGAVELTETLIPLDEEDGKRVWDQLQRELPTFALFQADRPSKDDDPEVADPMKVAVAAAVKEVEADLEAIKNKVRESAMEVARRTLAKLQEMAPELANELVPSFKAEPKWDGFKLTLASDDQIPINKRGSGARRLILLNFFRAEAERRQQTAHNQNVIFAIEEPESSQHPDNQVMLIRTLLDMADNPNTQILITTHVPGIASLIPTDHIRFLHRNDDGHPVIESGADGVYERVCKTLGVTPDRRAQLAIYVEGPNDVSFLLHASKIYQNIDATLLDLDTDHRIAFVPTGGGNLKHWVNNQYLRNAGLVEVHIYDRDDQQNPPYEAQIDAVNARNERHIGFLTNKRELENYIHQDAIQDIYEFQIQVTDWCDVPALVAEQVHTRGNPQTPWVQVAQEKRDEKASSAKRRLNSSVMERMTLARLRQSDAQGEILTWLAAIRDRVH